MTESAPLTEQPSTRQDRPATHTVPTGLSLGVVLVMALSPFVPLNLSYAQTEHASPNCQAFEDTQPSFDTAVWDTDFCKHSVPYSEIKSGGPGRDQIPPIDDPSFVPVHQADQWIDNREPVILLELEDAARAYPLQVLVWHEIVNDRLQGRPVTVTFCPLCYTAIVFQRPVVNGDTLTFGTTGNLRHSDLVMWDRQTESWWQQFNGKAIVGRLTGQALTQIPSSIISWRSFKQQFPDGTVLSRDTGYNRPYGSNPYAGYDTASERPFMYDGPISDKLLPKARIVGVQNNGVARAYETDLLQEAQVVQDSLGGAQIVLFWQEGTASAVDRGTVADGKDIGATAVYIREANGQTLSFEPTNDGQFVDQETESTWNLVGEAVSGPLKGHKLESVVHYDTFWFVWSAFQPNSPLYDPEK